MNFFSEDVQINESQIKEIINLILAFPNVYEDYIKLIDTLQNSLGKNWKIQISKLIDDDAEKLGFNKSLLESRFSEFLDYETAIKYWDLTCDYIENPTNEKREEIIINLIRINDYLDGFGEQGKELKSKLENTLKESGKNLQAETQNKLDNTNSKISNAIIAENLANSNIKNIENKSEDDEESYDDIIDDIDEEKDRESEVKHTPLPPSVSPKISAKLEDRTDKDSSDFYEPNNAEIEDFLTDESSKEFSKTEEEILADLESMKEESAKQNFTDSQKESQSDSQEIKNKITTESAPESEEKNTKIEAKNFAAPQIKIDTQQLESATNIKVESAPIKAATTTPSVQQNKTQPESENTNKISWEAKHLSMCDKLFEENQSVIALIIAEKNLQAPESYEYYGFLTDLAAHIIKEIQALSNKKQAEVSAELAAIATSTRKSTNDMLKYYNNILENSSNNLYNSNINKKEDESEIADLASKLKEEDV